MGLWKSVKKAVKKVAKVALPVAATAGLGYLAGNALGLFGSSASSAAGTAAAGTAAAGAATNSAANSSSALDWAKFGLAGVNSASSLYQASRSEQIAQQNLQQQMAWNEYAAQHAHQWEMQDLKAAGLNPILTATGGNGATVHSVTPQMPDLSGYSDSLNNAFNVLQGLNTLKQQEVSIAQGQEQVSKTQAETGNINANTSLIANNSANALIQNEILRHELHKARFEAYIRERFPQAYATHYLYGNGNLPSVLKAFDELGDYSTFKTGWPFPFDPLYIPKVRSKVRSSAKDLIYSDFNPDYFYLTGD